MPRSDDYDISKSIDLKDAVSGGSQQTSLEGFLGKSSQTEQKINTDELLEVYKFPTEELSRIEGITFADRVAEEVTDYTHGMHTYPAKFVPQIPRWAFRLAELDQGDTVYDPFVGCGTTMVEARLCGLNSYGTDISPLARMMTEVKSNPLFPEDPARLKSCTRKLLSNIRNDTTEEELTDENEYFNPPINWDFWFPEQAITDLVKIKRHILNFDPPVEVSEQDLRLLEKFYLINLSSIVDTVSYQDENQIKVRKDDDKFEDGFPETVDLFEKTVEKNQRGAVGFAKKCGRDGLFAKVVGEDARTQALEENSVDLVVTSPPYINAIDYTMAHRRSLIFLDFFDQESYKEHRREYVGMTERAVTKDYYDELRLTGYDPIDEQIKKIFEKGERKDKIRAFILYQYFTGMEDAFESLSRVLKEDAYCVIVVGDNEIRNEYIPTAKYLRSIAESVGFDSVTNFKHYYRKVQLQTGRRSTGGKIDYETVLILQA